MTRMTFKNEVNWTTILAVGGMLIAVGLNLGLLRDHDRRIDLLEQQRRADDAATAVLRSEIGQRLAVVETNTATILRLLGSRPHPSP